MARLSTPILVLALGCAAIVALASCGSSSTQGLLPGNKASEISANISLVENLADSGQCQDAANKAEEIRRQIHDLGHVDKQLKRTLIDGVQLLRRLAVQCATGSSTNTVPSTPSTATTGTVPTDTTPIVPKKPKKNPVVKPVTPPTTTPTTPTTPNPPTTPGGGGNGNGNNGNGNGNGGPSGGTGSGGIAP